MKQKWLDWNEISENFYCLVCRDGCERHRKTVSEFCGSYFEFFFFVPRPNNVHRSADISKLNIIIIYFFLNQLNFKLVVFHLYVWLAFALVSFIQLVFFLFVKRWQQKLMFWKFCVKEQKLGIRIISWRCWNTQHTPK